MAWLHRQRIVRVGQGHIYTVHTRYFWQGNHQIYGHKWCIYTILANPTSCTKLRRRNGAYEGNQAHVHTYTIVRANTRTRTHTRAHIHTHILKNTHIFVCSITRGWDALHRFPTASHARAHTHSHRSKTRTCLFAVYPEGEMLFMDFRRLHTRACTHTHTHTHTHTRTRTHTHTKKHTHLCLQCTPRVRCSLWISDGIIPASGTEQPHVSRQEF